MHKTFYISRTYAKISNNLGKCSVEYIHIKELILRIKHKYIYTYLGSTFNIIMVKPLSCSSLVYKASILKKSDLKINILTVLLKCTYII